MKLNSDTKPFIESMGSISHLSQAGDDGRISRKKKTVRRYAMKDDESAPFLASLKALAGGADDDSLTKELQDLSDDTEQLKQSALKVLDEIKAANKATLPLVYRDRAGRWHVEK